MLKNKMSNVQFLANINVNYPTDYKKLPKFFRVCCTNVIFNDLFKRTKIKGLNARTSLFLFPETSLTIAEYLEILDKKIDGESIYLNAIVVNNRMINIYNQLFLNILKEQKSVLLGLKIVVFKLLMFINGLLKYLYLTINFLVFNIQRFK